MHLYLKLVSQQHVCVCLVCCILCHIPSSKRQQDAADYRRGRRGGEGGRRCSSWKVVWLHVHLYRASDQV